MDDVETRRRVVVDFAARPSGQGERERGGNEAEREEAREISSLDLVFSELEGRSHGFYKAFSLVRYSESALARARFVRPAERRLRGRVKKTCFCSFEIGRSKLASLLAASSDDVSVPIDGSRRKCFPRGSTRRALRQKNLPLPSPHPSSPHQREKPL